jgi:hypothetical protein
MKKHVLILLLSFIFVFNQNVQSQSDSNKIDYISQVIGYDFLFKKKEVVLNELKKIGFIKRVYYTGEYDYYLYDTVHKNSIITSNYIRGIIIVEHDNDYNDECVGDSCRTLHIDFCFDNESIRNDWFDEVTNNMVEFYEKKDILKLIRYSAYDYEPDIKKHIDRECSFKLNHTAESPVLVIREHFTDDEKITLSIQLTLQN